MEDRDDRMKKTQRVANRKLKKKIKAKDAKRKLVV